MALDADFPFTKLITPDTMVGYSETAKVSQINKVRIDGCYTTDSLTH